MARRQSPDDCAIWPQVVLHDRDTPGVAVRAVGRCDGRPESAFRVRPVAALDTLREAGGIHGICHLVVLILTAETGFLGLPPDSKTAFIEVIGSELAALGVPKEHAFGDGRDGCPESLCSAYLPSIQLVGLLLRE